jgi:hypothetical protein
VEDKGTDRLPQFPSTPDGVGRMEHLPTIEACIRYWDAVRVSAIRTGERALILTAMGLLSSFEQARQELLKPERSEHPPAPRPTHRTRRLPKT